MDNCINEAQLYFNEKLNIYNKSLNKLEKQQNTKQLTDQEGFIQLEAKEQARYIVRVAQCLEHLTLSIDEQTFWTKRINDVIAEVE